jgi:hypothetical protein
MRVRGVDFGISNGVIRQPGTVAKSLSRATDITHPYVAPRTAKIHTPVTLECLGDAKPYVFRVRKRARVGSIPIARSTFPWLTLAYVVLGRAPALFSVPNVSMRPLDIGLDKTLAQYQTAAPVPQRRLQLTTFPYTAALGRTSPVLIG